MVLLLLRVFGRYHVRLPGGQSGGSRPGHCDVVRIRGPRRQNSRGAGAEGPAGDYSAQGPQGPAKLPGHPAADLPAWPPPGGQADTPCRRPRHHRLLFGFPPLHAAGTYTHQRRLNIQSGGCPANIRFGRIVLYRLRAGRPRLNKLAARSKLAQRRVNHNVTAFLPSVGHGGVARSRIRYLFGLYLRLTSAELQGQHEFFWKKLTHRPASRREHNICGTKHRNTTIRRNSVIGTGCSTASGKLPPALPPDIETPFLESCGGVQKVGGDPERPPVGVTAAKPGGHTARRKMVEPFPGRDPNGVVGNGPQNEAMSSSCWSPPLRCLRVSSIWRR